MITIAEYNPAWPAEFDVIRQSLHDALGSMALRIDHIGSTAVPGLGAKDIIDIQVTVHQLEPAIMEGLTLAGYRRLADIDRDHVPPGEDETPGLWSKMLFVEPVGWRRANIHVRVQGNPNQRYPILFRDYLRAHPQSAKAIELIKREIAKRHPDDVEAYYDIKDPVYDLVWDAARDWAIHTRWK